VRHRAFRLLAFNLDGFDKFATDMCLMSSFA
jgi:hypothetical protein